MQVNINTVCKGDSLWSHMPGHRVHIHNIHLHAFSEDGEECEDADFGELMADFSQNDWNTSVNGLIYTDRGWLRSFRVGLRKLGFSWKACMDVDYSEQGMQTRTYVSMDVGEDFIKEYFQKF